MTRLTIKPAYTLTELAASFSVDRRTMRRILDHQGVEIVGDAKLAFVSIAEIERKLPSLFEGIKVAHALHEALR
jgi:hypothetical protein